MRVPTRKSETDKRLLTRDEPLYLTKAGIEKRRRTIQRIQQDLPEATAEVTRTQAMGDLSENAAYQEAKYRLRRMRGRLMRLQEELKIAIEISPQDTETVELGNTVTVRMDDREQAYTLVGPKEVDLAKGYISHASPLGSALMRARVGDIVTLTLAEKTKSIEILTIS